MVPAAITLRVSKRFISTSPQIRRTTPQGLGTLDRAIDAQEVAGPFDRTSAATHYQALAESENRPS
jgi:hypothetical protein